MLGCNASRAVCRPCRRCGFTLVEAVVVIAILGVLTGLLLAAVQKARGAAQRLACANNMRQMGLAMHHYHDNHHGFPPGVVHPAFAPPMPQLYGPNIDPYPLLNWHGRLLPYIEQGPLWQLVTQAYAEDPSVDDPPHVGMSVPVPLYVCPADGLHTWLVQPGRRSPASTSYLGVSGASDGRHDGLLFLDSHIAFADILDGTSSTLLVGERPAGVAQFIGRWYGGWGTWGVTNAYLGVAETDVHVEADCPGGPYHFTNDRREDPCSIYHFWSFHPGGANFLFADGSVHFLTYEVDTVMPALATRAGGEAVSVP